MATASGCKRKYPHPPPAVADATPRAVAATAVEFVAAGSPDGEAGLVVVITAVGNGAASAAIGRVC